MPESENAQPTYNEPVHHVPLSALPVHERAAILEARRLFVATPFDLQAFLRATAHCNAVLNADLPMIGEANHG